MSLSVTKVFLVEDNPIDVRLLRYALEKDRDWPTSLTVVGDGEKAIESLAQSLSKEEKPDFIILDLNLPKRDGAEVLEWIRRTRGLQNLPVAILSSAPVNVIRDRLSQVNTEANCCLVKPIDVDQFLRLTKTLHSCFEGAVAGRADEPNGGDAEGAGATCL